MKKLLSMMLILAMTVGLLSACGNSNQSTTAATTTANSTTQSGGNETQPAATEPHGTMVYALTNSWGSLNPYHIVNYTGTNVHDKLWETLYSIDEEGNLVNRSCESYEVQEDGKVYIIHLRKDVKWHDGEPVTAADWEFAARLLADPAVTGMAGKTYPANLSGVDASGNIVETEPFGLVATDDYTLKFTLDNPLNYNLFMLNYSRFYHPLPKHLLDGKMTGANFVENEFWLNPVGCGPFKFVSTTPGEEVVFVANENFYYHVQIKNLIIRKVAAASLASSIISGDIDCTTAVDLNDLEELRAASGVTVRKANQTEYVYCHINNALCSKEVRQAINLAIDKQQIINTVLNGEGVPAETPINPASPLCGVDCTSTRDVAKAKELLAAAGWDSNTVITMATPSDFREDIALIMQQNLAEVGVQLKLVSCDQTAMQAGLKDGTYQMGMQTWGMHYQNPTYFQICQTPGSSINLSFIDYDDYANYCHQIDAAQDSTELYNLVQEYIKYMLEDMGHIGIAHRNSYAAWSANVINGPTASSHDLSWEWTVKD